MTDETANEIKAAERQMLDAIIDAMDAFTKRTGMVVSYLGTDHRTAHDTRIVYHANSTYRTVESCN